MSGDGSSLADIIGQCYPGSVDPDIEVEMRVCGTQITAAVAARVHNYIDARARSESVLKVRASPETLPRPYAVLALHFQLSYQGT